MPLDQVATACEIFSSFTGCRIQVLGITSLVIGAGSRDSVKWLIRNPVLALALFLFCFGV